MNKIQWEYENNFIESINLIKTCEQFEKFAVLWKEYMIEWNRFYKKHTKRIAAFNRRMSGL